MNNRIVGMALGVIGMTCASAYAGGGSVTYAVDMDGSQIVGVGDGDGTATGTITLDADNSMISWSITYTNLDAVVGLAIGAGGVGVNNGIAQSITDAGPAGDGMIEGSGGFNGGLIGTIIGFGDQAFIQVVTSGFAGGAVRGQLGTEVPAPGALCVMGIAGLAATRRKR